MKPLIATAVFGLIMMFCSLFVKEKKNVSLIAVILLTALTGCYIWELVELTRADGIAQPLFNNMLSYDSFSIWFGTLISGVTLLYVLLSARSIEQVGSHVGEYYALIFFILCGVNLLSGFGNLLILFLGIEILSIP